MTESVLPTTSTQPQVQEFAQNLSGGSMLKKAREASGLHIGAMAVALKVPVKKLEALEADQFDLLPDTVFVRALASSICRNLKIDPNPILERLPNSAAPRLKTDESGINTPFRENGDALNLSLWEQLSKPMVLGVVLVLIAILVLIFVPFKGFGPGAKESKVESVDAVVAESAPQPVASVVIETPVVVELPTPAPSPNVVESVTVSSPVPVPVLAASSTAMPTPPPAAATSLPVNAQTPVSADAVIAIKARGASWVEVIDAKGGVQVRKILNEGETIAASGAMPLAVVLGKADALEVQVHGKPFDLKRIAKENVARFEVK